LLITIMVVADTSLESAKADTESPKPRKHESTSAIVFTYAKSLLAAPTAPDGTAYTINIATDMTLLKYENPNEERSTPWTSFFIENLKSRTGSNVEEEPSVTQLIELNISDAEDERSDEDTEQREDGHRAERLMQEGELGSSDYDRNEIALDDHRSD